MNNYCERCQHEFEFGEDILIFMDEFVFCGDDCFIDHILSMGIERKVWSEESEDDYESV